jgi:DNA-binding NarL/FixJ family response regulator
VRVAVDSIVAAVAPLLLSEGATDGHTVEVFNAFNPPQAISTRMAEIRPDVVVVDSAWLVIASLLENLMNLSGLANAKRVVASRVVDDVLKIQVAHRGMHDVVDLNSTPSATIHSLSLVHGGTSSLANDELWRRVPRPTSMIDITTVPQDATDLAILELICIGYRDSDIAEVLGYSVQAVKNRLSGMLRQSELHNRTQLAWQFTNQLLTARMVQNMQQQNSRHDSDTPK